MKVRILVSAVSAVLLPLVSGAHGQGFPEQRVSYGSADAGYWAGAERRLAQEINSYRASAGLPPVPVSSALTAVARAHVRDLAENHPDQGPCGLHSWSPAGNWTPVCFTGDPRQGAAMWNKPREITKGRYRDFGFEIAVGDERDLITPEVAMQQWQGSPLHNDVILQQGTWANRRWQAMGVGVYRGYAVAWFGSSPDSGAPHGKPERPLREIVPND